MIEKGTSYKHIAWKLIYNLYAIASFKIFSQIMHYVYPMVLHANIILYISDWLK